MSRETGPLNVGAPPFGSGVESESGPERLATPPNIRARAQDVLVAAGPAVLLAAMVLVPFLGKAFTIDEPIFMLQAQHALEDPLHSSAVEFAWEGRWTRLSAIQVSGPVMSWLLMPAAAAGGSEVVAHLVSLIALCFALLATASLALRLGLSRWGAAVAALLVATTPAVLGMAGTAMPDVAAMAFLVTGVERLVAWKEQRGVGAAAAAAILLGLAPLTRPHVGAFLPFAALVFASGDQPGRWRVPSWRQLLPLAAAAVIAVSLAVVTRDPHPAGESLAGALAPLAALGNAGRNAVALLCHLVLVIPLALAWLIARPRHLLRRWPAFVGGAAAAALLFQAEGTLPRNAAIVPIAALGAAVLADVLVEAWFMRRPTDTLLVAWLIFPAATLPYTHFPAKYLVVSAPAVAIIVARLLVRSFDARRAATFAMATAAAGLFLGVAILCADARLAEIGRSFASTVIAPTIADRQPLWFAGEWGARWYAERAGARPIVVDGAEPAAHDLVISSVTGHVAGVVKLWIRQHCQHLDRYADPSSGGRTMSWSDNAGFYSNTWGYLPWAWGTGIHEGFDVWRCRAGASPQG